MNRRIDGLAACRGAGAKEVKRTAVVCHQKFQEITAKIPGNTGKIAGNTVKYTRKCQYTGKCHKVYQEMPQKNVQGNAFNTTLQQRKKNTRHA